MKQFHYLFLLSLFFSCKIIAINGQEQKISKKAESLYNQSMQLSFTNKDIQPAIDLLNDALKIEPNYVKVLSLLVQIYQTKKIDYHKAIELNDRIISIEPDNIIAYYNKANCQLNLKEYDKTKKTLEKFLSFENVKGMNRLKGEQILKNIAFIENVNLEDNRGIVFTNLGNQVNSNNDEYFPSLTSDNNQLYYTIKNNKDNYANEDIYVVSFSNGEWSGRKKVEGQVNSNYNEGAHCISSNGKYLLFASDNRRYENLGRFDIFIAKKVGNHWRSPNNLGNKINSYTWDSQPVLSADSKQLLFVSTKKGGFGGADIYISTIDKTGKFAEPENIGAVINTPFDEQRPYLHPDGKTLYFSSAGHPGMGANDLFKSTRDENGNWSKPINLGYPINTSGTEMGIFVSADGKTAYLSSDREGGFGGQDIYSFEMPEALKPELVSYLKGVVSDEMNKMIKANIKLYDLETGKIFKTFSSDEINGKFLETIIGGKNYALEAEAKGYLPFSENISLIELKNNEAFIFDIKLKKIEKGKEVTLNNIFFESGKFRLLENSKIELDYFSSFLQNNSQLNIEIGGHTDNVGSSSSNQILSEQRARSVMEYLVAKGIDTNRLSYKGYGDTKAISTNNDESGRAKNRRTSFRIL